MANWYPISSLHGASINGDTEPGPSKAWLTSNISPRLLASLIVTCPIAEHVPLQALSRQDFLVLTLGFWTPHVKRSQCSSFGTVKGICVWIGKQIPERLAIGAFILKHNLSE